jgi:hypothetical protein
MSDNVLTDPELLYNTLFELLEISDVTGSLKVFLITFHDADNERSYEQQVRWCYLWRCLTRIMYDHRLDVMKSLSFALWLPFKDPNQPQYLFMTDSYWLYYYSQCLILANTIIKQCIDSFLSITNNYFDCTSLSDQQLAKFANELSNTIHIIYQCREDIYKPLTLYLNERLYLENRHNILRLLLLWIKACGGYTEAPIVLREESDKEKCEKIEQLTVDYLQTIKNIILELKLEQQQEEGEEKDFLLILHRSADIYIWIIRAEYQARHKDIITATTMYEFIRKKYLDYWKESDRAKEIAQLAFNQCDKKAPPLSDIVDKKPIPQANLSLFIQGKKIENNKNKDKPYKLISKKKLIT